MQLQSFLMINKLSARYKQ